MPRPPLQLATLQSLVDEQVSLEAFVQGQHEVLTQKVQALTQKSNQLLSTFGFEAPHADWIESARELVSQEKEVVPNPRLQDLISAQSLVESWDSQEPKAILDQVRSAEQNTSSSTVDTHYLQEGTLQAEMPQSQPELSEEVVQTSVEFHGGSAVTAAARMHARAPCIEPRPSTLNIVARDQESIKHMYRRSGLLQTTHQENSFTRVVETKWFKHTVSFLIMVNSLFVGADMELCMQRALDGSSTLDDSGMWWGGHVFTLLFTVELLFRVPAYGAHFFLGSEWQWNTFDLVIVLAAWAEFIFSGIGGLSALRALRVLRLTRTLRILRVVTAFRPLMLILQSLISSLLSLLWMLVLLVFAMYLVTIVFMGGASSFIVDEFNSSEVSSDTVLQDMTHQEMRDAFRKDFGTVIRGMLTMFLSVTGGQDWYTVLQPLMIASWLYAVVFVAFEVFVVFGVFNVLAAVFVENVLTNRDKDLLIQSERHKTNIFMRDMADLFKEGDADSDGKMTLDELMDHCVNPRFSAYLGTHALDTTDAVTLFHYMDEDGGGSVDMEEFVLGALKLKGPARCLDMIKAQASFDRLNKRLDSVQAALRSLNI